MEFSASKIPRILKNCGHTICECCADILLRQRCNLGIACPMCQTVKDHYGKLQKKCLKHDFKFFRTRFGAYQESCCVGICGEDQDGMIIVINSNKSFLLHHFSINIFQILSQKKTFKKGFNNFYKNINNYRELWRVGRLWRTVTC